MFLFSYCLVFCSVRDFVKAVHLLVSSTGSYSVIVLSFGEGLCYGCSSSCFSSRLLFSYCLLFCSVRDFVKAVHLLVSSTGSYSVIVLSFGEGLCYGCSSSCFSSRLLFSYCLVFCLARGLVKAVHPVSPEEPDHTAARLHDQAPAGHPGPVRKPNPAAQRQHHALFQSGCAFAERAVSEADQK